MKTKNISSPITKKELEILQKQLAEIMGKLNGVILDQEEDEQVKKPKKVGRPKKQKKEVVENSEDENNKFLINNIANQEVDPKYGRKESLTDIKFKNSFNPKKEGIAQEDLDKIISKKFKPSKRNRPKAAEQISVPCDRCSRKYLCYEDEVDIRLSGDDESMPNICPRCIKNAR